MKLITNDLTDAQRTMLRFVGRKTVWFGLDPAGRYYEWFVKRPYRRLDGRTARALESRGLIRAKEWKH